MERVYALIERVAPTDLPVLIEGESGTGKELVARAIHSGSERAARPLVTVNCGGMPETLLESELFGHVRGAFTGADRARDGLFRAAHLGTLFLDEVGEMPARMQIDLLRALQDKLIRPLGSNRDVRVDARVIAASNRPLAAQVESGRFREDLLYRLNVVTIRVPALRERRGDIPLLVDHFLQQAAARAGGARKTVTRSALRRLVEAPWPGNVRQLEHAVTTATLLAESDTLDIDDFRVALTGAAARTARESAADERRNAERARMLAALEACGWNRTRAADRLGMPRRTFYRRLAEYDIG